VKSGKVPSRAAIWQRPPQFAWLRQGILAL
jgi:hypothetical protein